MSCKVCNIIASTNYQNAGYRQTENYVFYQRAYELKRRKRECIADTKELQAYLKGLWVKQGMLCYYTGIKMELTGYHTTPYAMTVDRLDSSKGYIRDNMVLCLAVINRIKQDLTIKELKDWVNLINTV